MYKITASRLLILLALSLLTACGAAGGGGGGAVAVITDDSNDGSTDDSTDDSTDGGNNSGGGVTTCETGQSLVNGVCTPDPVVVETCGVGESLIGDGTCFTHISPTDSTIATTEYNQQPALAAMKASSAYGRGYTGKGQIVSVLDRPFNLEHGDMADVFTDETRRYDIFGGNDPTCSKTNADNGCNASHNQHGTQVASVVASNKNDTDVHGIAYNATIIPVRIFGYTGVGGQTETDYLNVTTISDDYLDVIANATGADIVSSTNSWGTNATKPFYYPSSSTNIRYYERPYGNETLTTQGGTAISKKSDANFKAFYQTELDAWKAGVTDTVVVFANGNEGLNSETGRLKIYDSHTLTNLIATKDTIDILSTIAEANIPAFRAGNLPQMETELQDAWLTVVSVNSATDGSNKISSFSNGCGIAMRYCLAAPGENIKTASAKIDGAGDSTNAYTTNSGTSFSAPYVSGSLALIKEAFPNLTAKQLTRLTLETATYIPLDNKKPNGDANADEEVDNRTEITMADGTSKRYINPVYGYGLINLDEATKPNAQSSYVSASNNESIGVLWADTSLTLSSHFGNSFDSLALGIGDAYGRHFVVAPPKSSYAPVAIGLDDYMADSNLLDDNVQSERLSPQAQANYSNSEQSWMNLSYTSGKATTKIAFQESYKIKPLSDSGATSILRANNIRPASNNIGMMDVDYKLSGALSLSSYAARGEYDTGFKFDELGTDIDLRHKKSTINLGLGHLREHQQFLGANTTGAYALSEPAISQFTDVTYGHDVGKTDRFNLYANYIQYKTDVDMGYSEFARVDNLQADQYQVGFKGKNILSDDDNLNVALITKLGVTDGALTQNTVMGYTADGGFNNVTQSYDLALQTRHQQFEVTYQGRLYQHADKVSALQDNRFFATIRVDQNLNNEEGLGQTEVISGVSVRF